jgi:DNA uptake protein ComE-like DNA-binding protein
MKRLRVSLLLPGCIVAGLIALAGCTHCGRSPETRHADNEKAQQREDKVRDAVADATERAKPTLQKAGKKLGEAAKVLAQEAEAAAQGVREGWNRDERRLVNVNSAPEGQLLRLPGITRREVQRIVQNRPYRNTHELVAKGILSEARYQEIRDKIKVK